MNNLSSKQYVIESLPDDPSQITTGFVTDTFVAGGPPGSVQINYKKVGKLYFGFETTGMGFMSGIIVSMAGSNATNAARIATLLGLTVNTVYTATAGFAGFQYARGISYYNGSDWTDSGTASGSVLTGFLAN